MQMGNGKGYKQELLRTGNKAEFRFLFRRNYFLFVPPGQNPVYETPDYGIVKRTNFVKPVRKSGQKFAVHFLKFF